MNSHNNANFEKKKFWCNARNSEILIFSEVLTSSTDRSSPPTNILARDEPSILAASPIRSYFWGHGKLYPPRNSNSSGLLVFVRSRDGDLIFYDYYMPGPFISCYLFIPWCHVSPGPFIGPVEIRGKKNKKKYFFSPSCLLGGWIWFQTVEFGSV